MFHTLIITMWDSSRISRKWGFSTDRLMLGTDRMKKQPSKQQYKGYDFNMCRQQMSKKVSPTFRIYVILNAPLRARSLLQIRTAAHLYLLPAPEQKQNF